MRAGDETNFFPARLLADESGPYADLGEGIGSKCHESATRRIGHPVKCSPLQ